MTTHTPFNLFLRMTLAGVLLSLNVAAQSPEQPIYRTHSAAFEPIPHINQFPTLQPFTGILQFSLTPPSTGKTTLRHTQSYSATHYFQDAFGLNVGQDMEQFRHRTDWAVRVHPSVTLQYSQAILLGWDGFLDPFLNWYHAALSLPNYGREESPDNTYRSYVIDETTGRSVAPRKNTLYLSDPVLGAFITLYETSQTRTESGIHIQIPIGSVRGGMSTGAAHMAASLSHAMRYDPITLYGKAVITRPGESSEPLFSKLRTHIHGLVAGAYDYSEASSWLVQLHYMQSPFTNYGNHFVTANPVEIVIGYRRSIGQNTITLAFSEDPVLPAPDFTLMVSWQKRLEKSKH